ncbi:NAD(P)H-quinone oxidoreductase subunit N chloroplastic [Prunus yedoensis var. nudiflora]|uniref:NAD(P)H-quinone oxidoreductase subunit N chloroplastic n=1 Tax=Prunus yedoensis var. nudiflora TaxID=2094558 RepID=A0A314Y5E9_PRUYE|nr:NAD(P)H-quinone oxidoreductase subunit N chloroplastic [Prunus yedoensis var. nudiflora]
MAAANCFKHGTILPVSANLQHKQPPPRNSCTINNELKGNRNMMLMMGLSGRHGKVSKRVGMIRCSGRSIEDFIGGDLVRFDLGRWLSDVEEHKALAVYSPHEGGYEGRYLNRLRYQGYYFLDLSARGLGDPETTLTKVHPVCPPHLGKQPISRWYFPPEVDYRLAALPPKAKGLVVWIIEAKVLSKAELQFLALLPTLRPKVRVIAECGNWRKFVWKPLKEISGLTANEG